MFRRLTLIAAVTTVSAITTFPGPAAADPVVLPDIDGGLLSCTQLVPHVLSLDSTPVRLDLRVLLDGAPQSEAQTAVTAMRRAYEPIGVTIADSYQPVSFTGVDAAGLNQQAKDFYGGSRPAGIDVVYTMTTKDITAAGVTGNNVAGLADCIGGVRYPDRAFAVGEVHGIGTPLLPIPVTDGTGKIMAHEVGHLLGGHHHYSSPEGLLASDPNALTLMGPTLSLISLRFSTLNTLMVKGHSQQYARP
ncbi:zinc-dependent metalloprotease family protein [Actinokineospora sp. HUAS TT18]|uniref:zinc-dependent metalloprotease family protein n=1 Tax=Actinokineospora sp. HUAS TT18 TaxID=3447451 RepID=UPI003F51E859